MAKTIYTKYYSECLLIDCLVVSHHFWQLLTGVICWLVPLGIVTLHENTSDCHIRSIHIDMELLVLVRWLLQLDLVAAVTTTLSCLLFNFCPCEAIWCTTVHRVWPNLLDTSAACCANRYLTKESWKCFGDHWRWSFNDCFDLSWLHCNSTLAYDVTQEHSVWYSESTFRLVRPK